MSSAADDPSANLPVTKERLAELVAAKDNDAPVPILRQRADTWAVRDLLDLARGSDLARKGCDGHLRKLAECMQGRYLSVIWHCCAVSKAVDACMAVYTMDESLKDESLKDEMRRRYVRVRMCVVSFVLSLNSFFFVGCFFLFSADKCGKRQLIETAGQR